jgi:methionyl-tRNA synthetase
MKHLVTAALPYVNNTPHLGNLVHLISADIYARYLRLTDDDVISVCGTDEHGTTTELLAREKRVSPQELVDHYYERHKDIYDWFNLDFDCFGRTSSQTNHDHTQQIFNALDDAGYITDKTTEQLYDEQANQFLPDRYVQGTCPECGYDDANGDQCEQCNELLETTELINPVSTLTGSTPVTRETTNLYLDLESLQDSLEERFDDVANDWSTNAAETTKAWFNDGLKPRAITRDLDWGVQVPKDGFQDKVFYVWFDAPIGYISITEDSRDDWADWWHDDHNVHLTQFMGKDNIPFHTVMFPATLIGSGDDWTLIDTIESNEYLTYEDKKFSKSRGVGLFGDDAMNTGIPTDAWRYYIARNRPAKSDTTFTWDDFQEKHNAELIGSIANLLNRVVGYAAKQPFNTVSTPDEQLDYTEIIDDIIDAYDDRRLKVAVDNILRLAQRGNEYFQNQSPWDDDTTTEKRRHVVGNTITLIKDLGIVLSPVCPETADDIHDQIDYEGDRSLDALTEPIQKATLEQPEPIFNKLTDDKRDDLKATHDNPTNTPGVELRVGTITDVTDHDDADNLYVETVSIGDETRQVVSGLKPYYDADDLLGRNVVLVTNLEPAELRGVTSEAMLLAIDTDDAVSVITAPDYDAGDHLTYESITPNEQISFDDFQQLSLDFHDNTLFINNEPPLQQTQLTNTEHINGTVK